ncbi:MAG: YlmH/Sll1252 family protein [Bacilli bacterium]|jgi:RNA-binding protein YlmH|nr:YlmH/Sll1252 family protein [Bacilli bacterium]MCH4210292.1 YlmH/Sll1252 family protein [Bacilli bacterium]MCI2054628.1 YlmH/Sll1252 family protein [Bacilli bacterium]
MESGELLKRRIIELAYRASSKCLKTHTAFISSPNEILHELSLSGSVDMNKETIGDSSYFIYGGDEAERAVVFFLPSYMEVEEEKKKEEQGENIALLHIEGKNEKFMEKLTHRDYLGALMSLGYEREQFGDILVYDKGAYVYCLSPIAEEVAKSLLSVSHSYVKTSILAPKECPIKKETEEKKINVPSLRIDAVISECFSLSRADSKSLIENGSLFVNGINKTNTSYIIKDGDVVACKGFGKFIYEGETGVSRKSRIFIAIKVFK